LAWASWSKRAIKTAASALAALAAGLALLSAVRIMGFSPFGSGSTGIHYFNDQVLADYQPAAFAEQMRPLTRVATDFPPYFALQDMKLASRRVFGMQGRAPLLDAGLLRYLQEHGLIEVNADQVSLVYHLRRPWDFERLRRLGVTYVIAAKGDADRRLKPLQEIGPVALYELRQPGGVAYLLSDTNRPIPPVDLSAGPNGLTARLPALKKPDRLIFAERYRPGWRARVDGAPRQIEVGADGFLRVAVAPGDREARFEFAPVSWADYAAGAALALIGLSALAVALAGRRTLAAALAALALGGFLALVPRLAAVNRDDCRRVAGDLLDIPFSGRVKER
jgi:hypothetical protein